MADKTTALKILIEAEANQAIKEMEGTEAALKKIAESKDLLNVALADNDAIKQLGDDLSKLSTIDSFAAIKKDVEELTADLADAEEQAKAWGAEFERTGNAIAKLAADDAQREVDALTEAIKKQEQALQVASEEMRIAGLSTDKLADQQKELAESADAAAHRIAAFDTLGLQSAETLEAEAKAAQDAANALLKYGGSAEDVARAQKAANDKFEEVQEILGRNSTALKDFAAIGGRSIAEIEKEADEARAAFKRLEDSGEHSLEEIARAGKLLDKRLNDLEKEIKDVDDAAGKIDGNGFKELLSQIGAVAAATAGLQQALAAVGEYAGFEDDLLAVKALANASEAEFQRLKTAAFELAGAAGGPKAIAAAMGELAASGADVDEILNSVDLVGKLSGASRGALNFKDSGDLLTNTIKQLRLGMDAAVPVADRLAKGWNTAGHDGAELGDALAQVLPVATELYGHLGDTVPLEKSIAVINVLAETYKKGSEGGNAYLMMLRALAKPVGEGADALEKYKDQVTIFDDTGRIRDFADIIDDLAAAQMSTTDQLAIFGEAWPGVTALIGAGGDAIRKMEADVKAADGTVGATSDTLQGGLGGALREATAEIEKARLAAVDDFLPALQGILSLAQYADNAVAGLSGTVKTGAAIWSTAAGGITRYLSYLEEVTDYIGVTDDATNSLRETSDAFLGSARDLGEQASSSFKKAKGEVDPLAESQKQLAASTAALNQEYANISRVTGVTVTSMEELDAAVAAGSIRQDEATGKWIGTEKEKQDAIAATKMAAEAAAADTADAEEKARKAAKKEWEEWHKVVKGLVEDIADRERSLAEQLGEMERSGLSAAEAQKKLKEEARAAAEEARRLADEAQRLQDAGKTAEAQNVFKQALEAADASNKAWEDTAGNVGKATEELDKNKEKLAELQEEYAKLTERTDRTVGPLKSEQEELKKTKKEVEKLKESYEKLRTKSYLDRKVTDQEAAALRSLRKELEAAEDKYKSLNDAASFREGLDAGDVEKIKEAKEEIDKLKQKVTESEEALSAEKQALKSAMDGVKESGELGIEILKKQKEAAEENKNSLDAAFDFSKAEEAVDKLIKDKLSAAGPALADGIKDGVDSAVQDAERLSQSLDDAAKDRTATITITERTVQAALHGAQIMGRDMRGGAFVSGPVGYDSVHAILAGREAVTRNKIVDELGYNETFRPLNQGRYDIVMKRLAAFHGPDETSEILSAYLRPPEITMPMLPEMPLLDLPAQGRGSGMGDLHKLGTIVWEIGNTSVPVQIRTDHAALVQQELAKIKKGAQLKARAQGRTR